MEMPAPKSMTELRQLDKNLATKRRMMRLREFVESVAELQEFDKKMAELAALKRLKEVGAPEVQEEGVETVEKREESERKRSASDREEEDDVGMPAPKRVGRPELSLCDRQFFVEESGESHNEDEEMLDASWNVEGGQY